MVIFFTVFLIVPIGIAFAGSFHEWNPLSGTYRFLGLENYKEVFTSALFGKSMLNTVIFSVVVIFFRVGLGLGIAYAIYSTLIKYKKLFQSCILHAGCNSYGSRSLCMEIHVQSSDRYHQ